MGPVGSRRGDLNPQPPDYKSGALPIELQRRRTAGYLVTPRQHVPVQPAAIVARELDIRLIDTVCVSSYDHKDRGSPKVLKTFDGNGENWLIVDDLVDTGATAKLVREMAPLAHFATIYAKPAGKPFVDSFVTEVSQDTWILFPWDIEPAYAEPISGRR